MFNSRKANLSFLYVSAVVTHFFEIFISYQGIENQNQFKPLLLIFMLGPLILVLMKDRRPGFWSNFKNGIVLTAFSTGGYFFFGFLGAIFVSWKHFDTVKSNSLLFLALQLVLTIVMSLSGKKGNSEQHN